MRGSHGRAGPGPAAQSEIARDVVRRAHAIAPQRSLLHVEARLRRGDSSARQLGRLIEGSPALAARVLRMANSAFYAPREPVVGLARAVAMLGDTVLRQLVLTSLIMLRQADRRTPREALAAARLMGDAVRSAAVCRTLAALTAIATPDEGFSAGLLHDLGHMYLLDDVGQAYAGYLLDPSRFDSGAERELALAGTTHQQVGVAFADDWKLPPAIATVLREHHDPEPGPLAALVAASDRLVRELNHPHGIDPQAAAHAADAGLAAIGLDRAAWNRHVDRVREQYAGLLTAFDVRVA